MPCYVLTSTVEVFAREIFTAICLFKLLDSYFQPVPRRKRSSSFPTAIAYLERRVLSECYGGAPVLLRVRSVACRLAQESSDGRDQYDYIKLLCPLVVETCGCRLKTIWSVESADPPDIDILERSDLDSDVYIAAIYTNNLPVVTKWISSGKDLRKHSLIFGVAVLHAAKYSSHEVLAAMMTSWNWHDVQEFRASCLGQVAQHGRLEATRFVFNFQATEIPWEFSAKRSRPAYPFRNEQEFNYIITPCKEIFDFLLEKKKALCVKKTLTEHNKASGLVHCAENGWAEMAAQLIAMGAAVDGFGSSGRWEEQRPLLVACENGHDDVIRVLLAHGADTSQPALQTAVQHGQFAAVFLLLNHGAELGIALEEAVARGYRIIACALLKHDKNARFRLQDLLLRAVAIEDEALFQLLVDYAGGAIHGSIRDACVDMAREKGLESMTRLAEAQPTVDTVEAES